MAAYKGNQVQAHIHLVKVHTGVCHLCTMGRYMGAWGYIQGRVVDESDWYMNISPPVCVQMFIPRRYQSTPQTKPRIPRVRSGAQTALARGGGTWPAQCTRTTVVSVC